MKEKVIRALRSFAGGSRAPRNETHGIRTCGCRALRSRAALALMLAALMAVAPGLPAAASAATANAATASAEETASFKKFSAPISSEEIDLGKVHVSASGKEYEQFYAFLSKFPNLKKVDMYATVIDGAHIKVLKEKFPEVEFGWTMKVGARKIRTDITAFSTRHSDTSTRRSEETYALLTNCKNLLALDLGHNSIRDLSFLYDMPQLKVLILVDNYFQDITPIGSLKNLEYLEIFYNDVRDVSPLAGLTNLIDLNICFNRIEDLSPLQGLTQLERLWVSHANSHNVSVPMKEGMVEALRAALPNTLVDSTAKSSIGNHWRDHPRYKILKKMFTNSVYTPFE